jgi:hypothetical protein
MADMLADGAVKVTFVPSITNKSAPTVAELTGGTAVDLECLITADGLDISVDEQVVSIPKLCETFDAQSPGRATYGVTLTCVRKDNATEDVAWSTLVRKTSGYLVMRYGIAATTDYAATQDVIVFPVTFGERRMQKPEANGAIQFQSQAYVTSQPELDANVAA